MNIYIFIVTFNNKYIVFYKSSYLLRWLYRKMFVIIVHEQCDHLIQLNNNFGIITNRNVVFVIEIVH